MAKRLIVSLIILKKIISVQNYYFRKISGHVDDTYSLDVSVPSFQVSSTVDKNCGEKVSHDCDRLISFLLNRALGKDILRCKKETRNSRIMDLSSVFFKPF